MYAMENYENSIRFDRQYDEIRTFLQTIMDSGHSEHFHRGRLDWMMAHPYLDAEMLPKIALFRQESGALVGAALFDTNFDDRWYLLHSISDEVLLRQMLEYAGKSDGGAPTVKANLNDIALCRSLDRAGFEQQQREPVLKMDLPHALSSPLPRGFSLSAPDLEIDSWQWRLVIYHGFDHKGLPEALSEEMAEAAKRLESPEYIKVFAIRGGEYAAHCGVWYYGGDTAYVEPVATLPEHRGKGLGRAVVYEAVNRARERGAKRAIVLSNQEFYFHIGMEKSSEVATWVKKDK